MVCYNKFMNILVTGGAGYIGSHTLVTLYEAGHTAFVVDNLINSHQSVIDRVEEIVGAKIPFSQIDLRDKQKLEEVFAENKFDAVIHFAGLKAVGESVQKPLEYYDNNVISSIVLLESMRRYGVNKIIFSSSATVYGSAPTPYSEDSQTGIGIPSPYGQTKFMVEQIMKDLASSDQDFSAIALRYFNPIGAHESGKIGEDPQGIPNNLMPFIAQVANGTRQMLHVFGDDYPTPDGTCVRDYIHIMDLAQGHVAALNYLNPGFDAINLGSGHGTSVLEMINTFEKSTGVKIPYTVTSRRHGDLPEFYANTTKAEHLMNWRTKKTIQDACRDTWKWQSKNRWQPNFDSGL